MNLVFIICIAILGSQLSRQLIVRTSLGTVRASAMISMSFIILTELYPFEGRDALRAAFLGSSFLGMSDSELFSTRDLFFAALIFAFLFHFVLPMNIRPGGSLGVAAFTSCLIIRGFHFTASKISAR
jgi:hypothetical protein